jgi:hypothetical protein
MEGLPSLDTSSAAANLPASRIAALKLMISFFVISTSNHANPVTYYSSPSGKQQDAQGNYYQRCHDYDSGHYEHHQGGEQSVYQQETLLPSRER